MLGTENLKENERCPEAEARLNALFADETLHAHAFGLVTSTNDLLKAAAAAGETEGAFYVSDRQTAGKGTRGRSFYSPKNTGLYMSLLLRPKLGLSDVTLLTPLAAVAVAEAYEMLGIGDIGIKWVNDVFVRGKKSCGILAETALGTAGNDGLPTVQSVVVGIGINLLEPEGGFPEEIRAIAGAIFEGALPAPDAAERLAAAVANRYMHYYRLLPEPVFLESYRSRSNLLGKGVLLMRESGPVPAEAVAIDDRAGLVVRYPDGKTETVCCGDVSIRLQPNGSC